MGDCLSILQDVAVAASAVIVAIATIIGLSTWKSELRGRAKYDVARRYLRSVLKVRDEIRAVRDPFKLVGEIQEAVEEAGVEMDQSDRAVYQSRWNKLSAARSDLRVEAIEAEVLWGAEAQDKLRPLNEAIGELYANLHLYLDRLDQLEKDPGADLSALRAIIFERGTDRSENTFTAKVDAAVTKIEDFVRPELGF